MVMFSISADSLYATSKSMFYAYIPDCTLNFVHGYTRMSLNFRRIAATQKKTNRRKAVALVLKYCPADQIELFSRWLTDYFSDKMQMGIFELSVDENGKILPGKMLEKALKNI